jgi:hypothetical protein
MKQLIAAIFFFLLVKGSAEAQILKPVKWTYGAKKTGNNEAIIYVKATIDSPWHIYSLHVGEGGPVKTTIKLNGSPTYLINSQATEPTPLKKFEEMFSMDVQYFEKSVIFQQKIELRAKGPVIVKGTLEFMACNDEMCLLPEEIEFSVAVK